MLTLLFFFFCFVFYVEETFTQLLSSTPSACSRINSEEFVSVLFWTQLRHLSTLEEKQLLEHFASSNERKQPRHVWATSWMGLSSGKITGKGEMKTDKAELHEGPRQPVWRSEPHTGQQSCGRGHGRREHRARLRGSPEGSAGCRRTSGGGSTRVESWKQHLLHSRQRHKQNKTPATWDFFLLGEEMSVCRRFYSVRLHFFKISTLRINLFWFFRFCEPCLSENIPCTSF